MTGNPKKEVCGLLLFLLSSSTAAAAVNFPDSRETVVFSGIFLLINLMPMIVVTAHH